jgi:hypothetical protein
MLGERLSIPGFGGWKWPARGNFGSTIGVQSLERL